MSGGSEYRPESVAPMTVGQRHQALMDRIDRLEMSIMVALVAAVAWLSIGIVGGMLAVLVLR